MTKNLSHFRNIALAATVAACAIAVPAQARDGAGYVGVDLGYVIPQDSKIEVRTFDQAITVDNKNGWGADVLIGYDWGVIRTEAELGRQQWSVKDIAVSPAAGAFLLPIGNSPDADGKTKVTTAMANALLDFGGNGGIGGYVGAGAGRAWLDTHMATSGSAANFLDDSDSAWAWQGIAGVRFPVSDNVELGVKYKYLNTHQFRLVDALGRTNQFDAKSHSFMASLLVNFGGHAAPPPPPPVVAPQGERG